MLKFKIPMNLPASLPAPWGVKLHLPGPDGKGKSYSPVDYPNDNGDSDVMHMLVKPYPLQEGGGYGAHLCGGMKIGETAHFTLKPPRLIHGETEPVGKYDVVMLIGGGTGIAPLIQIARAEVRDSLATKNTKKRIKMLSVNRFNDDILMKKEIDDLVVESGGNFEVVYLDSATEGRGDVELAKRILKNDDDGDRRKMVYVCGTDGFVEYWSGMTVRDDFGRKQQGERPFEHPVGATSTL